MKQTFTLFFSLFISLHPKIIETKFNIMFLEDIYISVYCNINVYSVFRLKMICTKNIQHFDKHDLQQNIRIIPEIIIIIKELSMKNLNNL